MNDKKKCYLSPSILSADFSRLGDEVEVVAKSGCKYVHLDVMDGAFVPNITFGAGVIASFRKRVDIIFDTHLMMNSPERYINDFANCGSDYITVHIEATSHINSCINMIHNYGKKAGVSLNPGTSVSALEEILPFVDLVLVMSVNPGFGGQSFIPTSIAKVAKLDKIRKVNGYNYLINVDGGVSEKNSSELIKAGADLLVSGSAFFKASDKTKFRQTIED